MMAPCSSPRLLFFFDALSLPKLSSPPTQSSSFRLVSGWWVSRQWEHEVYCSSSRRNGSFHRGDQGSPSYWYHLILVSVYSSLPSFSFFLCDKLNGQLQQYFTYFSKLPQWLCIYSRRWYLATTLSFLLSLVLSLLPWMYITEWICAFSCEVLDHEKHLWSSFGGTQMVEWSHGRWLEWMDFWKFWERNSN